MVRSGMDAGESWRMVSNNFINGRTTTMSRGDPYAPWSPNRTWSGAIGAGVGEGIAGGIMTGMALRRMQPDIIRTTDANCPEFGLRFVSRKRKRSTEKCDKPAFRNSLECKTKQWGDPEDFD